MTAAIAGSAIFGMATAGAIVLVFVAAGWWEARDRRRRRDLERARQRYARKTADLAADLGRERRMTMEQAAEAVRRAL